MNLKDKTILITGSSRGIGYAIAEACAKEGAKVVISSRNAKAVEDALQKLHAGGYKAIGFPADVCKEEDLQTLKNFAINNFGRIDVWISNAGQSGGYLRLHDMTAEEIGMVVNTNLTGTLLAARIIIPYFIEQKGGILINLAGRGSAGKATPFMTPYAATKSAIASLTRSLAQEYKDFPISIHALMPGMVDTDLIRQARSTPDLEKDLKNMPLVMNAFGGAAEKVGLFVVKILKGNADRKTGKIYSILTGIKLIRGIALMSWYGITGKMNS
jgi:NAD(P)-dependent dehydrogenase (short-subunit alcohol dehydrogenase family)